MTTCDLLSFPGRSDSRHPAGKVADAMVAEFKVSGIVAVKIGPAFNLAAGSLTPASWNRMSMSDAPGISGT